jgi:uncharacterized YccA/Bax inhibitor family protein
MTLDGTINKTLSLLAMVFLSAVLAYGITGNNPGLGLMMMIGGAIGGFILVLIISFTRPQQPQVLMSCYAILEGLFVGGMSYSVENWYLGDGTEGAVAMALIATIGVFITMLGLYRARIIQPTQKFVIAVFSIAGAIMLVYLAGFVMSFTGMQIPYIHNSGPIGIGFSIVATAMASLFLIIDFGVIENGVKNGAPKSMEWYGAFGLVITLVWLYIELLRLIAKLRD